MNPDDGWKRVTPRVGGERLLSRAELEKHERQILQEWEQAHGHWSGIGKHTPDDDFAEAKKLHHRFKLPPDPKLGELGSGSYGKVEKVHFLYHNRTICLARKHIPYRRKRTIQMLREEANVMEKLDHEHIVKLVGTYCIKPNELFILLWPVAVCDLDQLFNDLYALTHGEGDKGIHARLQALELHTPGQDPQAQSTSSLTYLQCLIGCITRAVAYSHEAGIRHLDLKPKNILLCPGHVYLADFGIAKDVHDKDHTMTMGVHGTLLWGAPEMRNPEDEWSMKAADVYALGLVLLALATVIYGADMADFDAILKNTPCSFRSERLDEFHSELEGMALATQEFADPNAPTFAPRHILGLTSRMLSSDPSKRPAATQVDDELVDLGGIEQVYHAPCCRKSTRQVMDRMSGRLSLVTHERNKLQDEKQSIADQLEVLRRKDETYEARIQNERKILGERIANVQAQLKKEKEERTKAVEELQILQRTGRRPRPTPYNSRLHGASEIAIPTGPSNSPGLTMRTRQTYPQPAPSSPSPLPAPQPQRKASINTVTLNLNPTSLPPSSHKPISPVPGPVRRVSMPRASASSPGPSLIPVSNSPTPDLPGFPLRSRNSGSRLPQPVNPATPIPATPVRSGTPNLNRDSSSTDDSMVSSTFSRFSGYSRHSGANTSVAGTPALESSPFNVNETAIKRDDKTPDANGERPLENEAGPASSSHETVHAGLGLGLGPLENAVRRESVASDRPSLAGSSAGVSVASPVLSSSTLSSPRATYAVLDPRTGLIKPPAMPTAKSWADIARRERRAVNVNVARG